MKFYNYCCFNMNGSGKEKIPDLKKFLKKYLIELISETHLTENRSFNVPGYREQRYDNSERSVGTALLVKEYIPHSRIEVPELDRAMETVCVVMFNGIVVVALYKNPKYKLKNADLEKIFNLGERADLEKIFNLGERVL